MTSPDKKESENCHIKLTAQFWRSPFAVTAALAFSCQAVLMLYASITNKPLDYNLTMSMTTIAAMMLVAGTYPRWNFIQVSKLGIEQHAGLTRMKTNWKKVKHVRVFPNWVEIRHIDGELPGEKRVRTVRILNRYGVSSDEFGDMIEERWRTARGLDM